MDPPQRRTSRVIDPVIRKVGFSPVSQQSPSRTQSGPPGPSSPSNNSLSPVMIPPPRHASDNLSSLAIHHNHPTRPVGVPVPSASMLRRRSIDGVHAVIGSYNQSESVLGTSPPSSSGVSPSSRIGDGEFSEDSVNWIRRSNSGKLASSVPAGGFNWTVKKAPAVSESQNTAEKDQQKDAEISNELPSNSKPSKEKTTKAERRALQESQRAAKGSGREGKKYAASGGVPPVHDQTGKSQKQTSQKKDGPPVAPSVAGSERKGGDRPQGKDRKKDVPPPRLQFDDKNRVDKAQRRAVVKQTEARNRVELFRHLPQYEHGTQLPDLEAKFFQLDPVHSAVYKEASSIVEPP